MALIHLANAAAQLPYGSGKTKGVLPYGSGEMKGEEKGLKPGTRWHLSVSPTLFHSYPTGQVRRKEKG